MLLTAEISNIVAEYLVSFNSTYDLIATTTSSYYSTRLEG